jgi:hypothetical protein
VTILLACAVAVKVTIIPALVAWLAWLWWAERGDGRLRVIGMHIVATAAVLGGLALIWPGRAEFAALPRQVGIEGWASPAHLVAGIAQTIIGNVAGSRAGRAAGAATIALFLVGYAALFVVMLRRWRRLDGENGLLDGRRAADRWGVTMLLFALCAPCLLPWYAAWFVPFAGLMFDTALVAVAGVASALLALTLIPADPPRGLSSWGVMLGVHYLVAPLMLVLLAVTVSRALRSSRPVVPMAGDGTDAGSRGL